MSMDAVIIGRLTEDCASKVTEKTGKMIHTFTVASNRGFGDRQETDYVECIAFAPNLDKQVDFLTKGTMVKVCGHFQTRKVPNAQTGKNLTYWNCVVDSCELLWGRKRGETTKGGSLEVNTDYEGEEIPF